MNGERLDNGLTVANDDYTRRAGGASAGWRRGAILGARRPAPRRWTSGDFPGRSAAIRSAPTAGSTSSRAGTTPARSAASPSSRRCRTRIGLRGQTGFNRIDSDFASPFGTSEAFSRRWNGGGAAGRRRRARTRRLGRRRLAARTRRQHLHHRRLGAGSAGRSGSAPATSPKARWNSQRARVRDRGPSRRRHPARSARGVARSVLAAARAARGHRRVGEPAARRRLDRAVGRRRLHQDPRRGRHRHPSARRLRARVHRQSRLRPERSTSAEAGVDQAFAGGHAVAEATVFTNHYDDLIVAVGSFSGSSRFRTDNISNARASGLELALTRARPGDAAGAAIDLAGRVGYTALDTEILAVDQDDDAPPPFTVGPAAAAPSGAPVLRRRVAHDRPGDRVRARQRPQHRARRRTVVRHLRRAVRRAGLQRLERRRDGACARDSLDVFARVENLFDRTYEEAFGFPALGRRATVGLRIAAGR